MKAYLIIPLVLTAYLGTASTASAWGYKSFKKAAISTASKVGKTVKKAGKSSVNKARKYKRSAVNKARKYKRSAFNKARKYGRTVIIKGQTYACGAVVAAGSGYALAQTGATATPLVAKTALAINSKCKRL